MNSQALLDVVGLSVERTGFDGRSLSVQSRLLEDINLSLAKGEVVGVIGGSGAGKSTLGRALLGYTRPGTRIVGGQINFKGRDVTKMSESELRHFRGGEVAYIAQNPASSFNPSLTIGSQITEVIKTHQGFDATAARHHAHQLISSLHLPDPERFASRYAHQVSGGQLQRAMIAMALAGAPSLIVFDEPTTALDPHTRVAVVALIASVVREYGMSAIYISHDLEIVNKIADRVVRLERGALISSQQVAASTPRVADTQFSLEARGINSQITSKSFEAVLQVTNVSAGFSRGHRVLKGVSFSLTSGSSLGMVGRSGSGKSTLARVICGLHPTYDGQVSLRGTELAKSIRRRDANEARRVQMVYQSAETAINPEHTVERILGRVLRRFQESSATETARSVVSLLMMVGLDKSFLKRKTREMSGGQIQRIGIARALAARPDLLVLDEVTSALDAETADEILQLLRTLQRQEGLTYLFISHDFSAISKLCDEVAVIANGEIVEVGPTFGVLNASIDTGTRELLEIR